MIVLLAMVDEFLRLGAIVVAAGAAVYAIRIIWLYMIKPVYLALLSLAEFMEAQPTLLQIAHEFQPNDGDTLRDQIDSQSIRLGNIEGQLELLVQSQVWDGTEERRNGT